MARLGRIGAALALAAALAAPTPASAAAGDYWIVGGDQAGDRLIAFDPAAASWDSSSAVRWTWAPTTALGFSAAEVSAFGLVTDFKLRDVPAGGQRFVVSDSNGFAAVVSYPGGTRQWAKVLPGNLHSAELLPNGNIAIAASDGGWVRVYASSQGSNASTFAQYDLDSAHATLWDPAAMRLWVIGQDPKTKEHILTALVVGGTPANPTLREDTGRRAVLPTPWGHDVTAYNHDPDKLWVTTNTGAYLYDKATTTFTVPGAAGRTSVKSIGNQPSGQIVETRPSTACTNSTWCTDTVDFYSPDTTRTRTGAAFYKARVWSPYYNAVDQTLHGTVWDRAAGSSPTRIDDNPAITRVAAAALPDGTLHVVTLVPGSGVWHKVRDTAGSWSGATKIDGNGDISAVSLAALPNGTLHLTTVVPGSGVWHKIRDTAGTWSGAAKIDNNGTVSALSLAALPNGTLHLVTLVPGSGVWHKIRDTAGNWSSATLIDDNSSITEVALAGLGDGTLHLATVVPDSGIWHKVRTGGTWSSASKIDPTLTITAVSLGARADGTLQLDFALPGNGVWERVRGAGGAWSASTKVDGNGSVLDTYSVGLPDGTAHLGTVPDIS